MEFILVWQKKRTCGRKKFEADEVAKEALKEEQDEALRKAQAEFAMLPTDEQN